MTKKVFVSGCYDMLHSGHIAFFRTAATYGDLYVALGSDKTVYELKGRVPVNSEQERLYMVKAVNGVTDAFVSSGSGMLDFEGELRAMQPDIFVVNADGNTPQKEALCRSLGVEYVVLERQPHADLPPRSTTALRQVDQMPYRIDLAGGWLDQPFVSQLHPGPVITISLEPTIAFNERSGMATSTRNHALELWGPKLPPGDPEKLAYILFCYDNPPGTEQVSGSQDAIGIAMPGLNIAHYEGKYWPSRIEHIGDEMTLQFIEQSLYLMPLGPREDGYNPLDERKLSANGAKALADAALGCWQAILNHDLPAFGGSFRAAFDAQVAMFPHMVNADVLDLIERHQHEALGWKLSGAGGGGYVIFVADKPIKNAVRVSIRRELD
ncbi:MAG: adenylyltransferase/cytidyltransferase family protein [Chloroflexi bacterium]|nr:adenylyltransferase/cytidyltransferase family protein [Chloroflexota bacterium]MCC6896328.1 adenylyltransferase/cytidyltransferase family protein [Anaerolineae bacterium]